MRWHLSFTFYLPQSHPALGNTEHKPVLTLVLPPPSWQRAREYPLGLKSASIPQPLDSNVTRKSVIGSETGDKDSQMAATSVGQEG